MALRISSQPVKDRIGGLRRPVPKSLPRLHRAMDYVTIVNRTGTPQAPSKKMDLRLRFEPLYRVMLHYSLWRPDDVKAVAQKVNISVPILTKRECEQVVRQAEAYGVSIVCTVTHEMAILYCDALSSTGLNVTLEEA